MKENDQFKELIEELRSLPEPNYDKEFDISTQDRIHENLMQLSRNYEKKQRRGAILKQIVGGLAGIAVLLIFSFITVSMMNENTSLRKADENYSNELANANKNKNNIHVPSGIARKHIEDFKQLPHGIREEFVNQHLISQYNNTKTGFKERLEIAAEYTDDLTNHQFTALQSRVFGMDGNYLYESDREEVKALLYID